MNFSSPENPDDLQTAYTHIQAQRDSNKHGNGCVALVTLGFIITLSYVSIMQYFNFEKYSVLIIALSIAFFATILIIPFRYATRFLTEFYRPPDGVDPVKIIKYRLFGKPTLPPLNTVSQFESIIARDGEIDDKDKWPAWSALNLGGPLKLVVVDGCALYLERSNRFSRIVGPGDKVSFLEWFETIKYVVDLRPKVKTDFFNVWTKDGINLIVTAQIECRIGNPSKNDPGNRLAYPYDPVAIKKAIERYSLRWPLRLDGEPSELTWIDAAWGQVTGIVPGYIGSRTVEDLFIADQNSGQLLSPAAIDEVKNKLNMAANSFGVFITDFQILKIDLPIEVREQLMEHWKKER